MGKDEDKKMSRRDFLKFGVSTAAAAAAGGVAGHMLYKEPQTQDGDVVGDNIAYDRVSLVPLETLNAWTMEIGGRWNWDEPEQEITVHHLGNNMVVRLRINDPKMSVWDVAGVYGEDGLPADRRTEVILPIPAQILADGEVYLPFEAVKMALGVKNQQKEVGGSKGIER